METQARPTMGKIRRHNGVAGQYAYTVTVTYPGEEPLALTFIGSAYGHPTYLEMGNGRQVFVRDAGRYGPKLSPEWVRRFVEDRHA